MAEPSARIVTLDPALARSLLIRNAPSRTKASDPFRVRHYAGLLKCGDWLPTYGSVLIGASGQLMDGQHRCMAVIASGVSFPIVLVEGVPDEAAWAMDPPLPVPGEVK
jgi:hypothetical protein